MPALNCKSFASVLTGIFVGFAVFFVRRLKLFIIFGTLLFLAAFGTLIHFRGGTGGTSHSGIIGAQIFLGIGKKPRVTIFSHEELNQCSWWLLPLSCASFHSSRN